MGVLPDQLTSNAEELKKRWGIVPKPELAKKETGNLDELLIKQHQREQKREQGKCRERRSPKGRILTKPLKHGKVIRTIIYKKGAKGDKVNKEAIDTFIAEMIRMLTSTSILSIKAMIEHSKGVKWGEINKLAMARRIVRKCCQVGVLQKFGRQYGMIKGMTAEKAVNLYNNTTMKKSKFGTVGEAKKHISSVSNMGFPERVVVDVKVDVVFRFGGFVK